jgi:BNR/Asp-box repeat
MRSTIAVAACATLAACGGGGSNQTAPNVWTDSVTVRNPLQLPATLPAQRVQVGTPGEYKPNLIVLPTGDTLLVDFLPQHNTDGTYQENLYLYRSSDGGQTWARTLLPLLGREAYFTLLSDGTLLMSASVVQEDYRNVQGYTYAVLYRSTDNGMTWSTAAQVLHSLAGGTADTGSSRNVLELADGTLLWEVEADGVGDYAWRSNDQGQTWNTSAPLQAVPVGFNAAQNFEEWCDEMVLAQAQDGSVLGFARVYPLALPIPGIPIPADSVDDDQDNYIALFRSADAGQTWTVGAPVTTYGEMYPNVLTPSASTALLTYTVRALGEPLGVQAVLGTVNASGFVFDFTHDILLLDEQSPNGNPGTYDDLSGGGFGNTVQEADGTLVTAYSYRDLTTGATYVAVVRLPPGTLP